MKNRTLFFGYAALALMIACGGTEQRPAQVSTTSGTPSPMPTTETQPEAQTPPETQTTPPTTTFNDSQIAAIANAAHDAEIAQAKLALHKAKDPQVKAFAQMMIEQHGEAKKQAQSLVTTLGITPEPTSASTGIENDSESGIKSLDTLSGHDFDKAYIDLQVKGHKDVLDMLDQKLIPLAKSPELKKALTDFRPKVADHLARAQELQQKLSMH